MISDFDEPEETASTVSDNSPAASTLKIKSHHIYAAAYKRFNEWCASQGVEHITEDVCLAYFTESAKIKKPTSLLAEFSMINQLLMAEKNISIKNFSKLAVFLKQLSSGYKAKRSKAFSIAQILKFLNEAPDEKYLMLKVILYPKI